MDDLISRQAAIDAVSEGCQEWRGIFARCEENIKALPSADVPDTNVGDTISRQAAIVESQNEKQILDGCISLIQEMCDYFREYLDFIGVEPEFEEEKQPFCMSYFHIVNRLFLWDTRHSGGNSTRTKCAELGIDDSSKQVLFKIWEDEDEE